MKNRPAITPHLSCAALALTLALSLCPASSQANPSRTSAVSIDTEFAVKLYAHLAKENPGDNLFFSPYSISSALAMAAEGARGGTALEMGTTLGMPGRARTKTEAVPWDFSVLHEGHGALDSGFNREGKPYELEVANAIWGEQTFPFNAGYLDTIRGNYGANGLRTANFIGDPEAERLRINAWARTRRAVASKTCSPRAASTRSPAWCSPTRSTSKATGRPRSTRSAPATPTSPCTGAGSPRCS